jgi:uncharacterized membrane protein
LSSEPIGHRISDAVARVVGSWRFVIIQSTILILWLLWNSFTTPRTEFDPYPYILLNLVLSFQAAYTAPLIMMSQNRQAEVDRKVLHGDFEVDKKTHELITQIHKKIHEIERLDNG